MSVVHLAAWLPRRRALARRLDERPDVKIRKLAVLPVLAGSAVVASVAFGAGAASSGTGTPAGCPTPVVTVSPSTAVHAGSSVTITGKNFGCNDVANQSYPVKITFYTGALASSNRTTLGTSSATAKNGSFLTTASVPTGAAAGSEVDVLAETTSGTDLQGVGSLTLAGSSNSGGSLSVPAGHVDVATGGVSDLDVALLLVGGAGLVAGGTTLAIRRRSA